MKSNVKKKSSKKVVQSSRTAAARRAKSRHPKRQELMSRLEFYLRGGQRNIIAKKLNVVMVATGKSRSTIKNAYLFGEGDTDFWFQVEDIVSPINHSELFQLWDSWPNLKQKYDSLEPEQKSIHRNLAKLSYEDTVRLDHLLKSLIATSKILQKVSKKS